MDGRRVVLVVEDEADVRELTVMILLDLGYAVRSAVDAATALSILKTSERIDLLFTDILMRGSMDGFSLALTAKQLRPDLKVLYTTGNHRLLGLHSPMVSNSRSLKKPWRVAQLKAAIAELLSDVPQTEIGSGGGE